jgi:hypothetical protein
LLQGGAIMVTEAAGASVTLTGYKRGLNQVYNFDFLADAADRSINFARTKNQPIGGGAPEVLLDRQDDTISVSIFSMASGVIDDTIVKQLREFLSSVSAGETFVLDCYGTLAAPVEPINVVLSSDSYKEERIGGARYFKLSFDALVI